MATLPEPEDLRISPAADRAAPSRRPPRHRPGEPFLLGPIPWAWLDRAGRLPGRALAVGLVLWRLAGLNGRRSVHVCLSGLATLGLNEHSARRGIRALEHEGLIEVGRRPGRGLDVTLLAARDGLEGRCTEVTLNPEWVDGDAVEDPMAWEMGRWTERRGPSSEDQEPTQRP